ncbi:MAG: FG-GAP-like repeat-containing protein [Bacteroidota bacterium]
MANKRTRLDVSNKLENKLSVKNLLNIGGVSGIVLAALLMTTTSNQPLTDVFFSTTTPQTIYACGTEETFVIEYLNTSGFGLTGQELTLTLPPGINYVAGSATSLAGPSVSDEDVSDPHTPVLSIGDLEDGGTAQFSIQYTADLDAVTYLLSGSTPSNALSLSTNEGQASYTSESYNVLYAALTIQSVNPTSQTVISGDTASRTLAIINGGNGRLSSFYLTDTYGAGIDLVDVSIGTLNVTHDTIFFNSADFAQVGNGNGFLETNESFSITEKFIPSGCTETTVSSVIKAEWGCGGNTMTNSTTNASISTAVKTPSLSATATASFSGCMDPSTPNAQQITIENTGEGIATEVSLRIFKSSGGSYDQDIFSALDTSSFTYKLGANGSTASPSFSKTVATRNDGSYSCLGASPIGDLTLSLPNINPGETYIVDWNSISCCVNACLGELPNGWKYTLSYNDPCNSGTTSSTAKPETPAEANMTMFTESPSDIQSGQKETFTFNISSQKNTFPETDYAYYELVFDIPDGLSWSGNSDDLSWHSGKTDWAVASTSFNSSTRKLTAKFNLPLEFDLPKSTIDIDLTGDCANFSGVTTTDLSLGLSVNFIPDSTCNVGCSVPIMCEESTSTTLHCPGTCNEGLAFKTYDIDRISFGISDNNQDGTPDSPNAINLGLVKTNRAMVSDTLRGTFMGVVKTSGSHPSWAYGYATSSIEDGSKLTAIGASVKVYDASSGSYITCNGVGYTGTVDGDDQDFLFDFSPSTLSGSCGDFSSFTLGNGDTVWLYTDYKVTGNIGDAIREVDVENTYYVSDQANPTQNAQKYACDNWGGRFTLIGYYFKVDKAQNVTIKGCNKYISQNYYLSIGDCCSNYHGGNLFPYEYRNWGNIKQAEVVIPENYEVLDIYLKEWRTKFTNGTASKKVSNLQADETSGDTLRFNLDQYYENQGGTIPLSDDGFKGALYVKIAPTCDVPINTFQNMPWKFTFQEASPLGGQETDWYDDGADRVRFSPPAIAISSPHPTIDGLSKTVTWTVNLKNTSSSSGSDNVWMHLKTPSGKVQIESVVSVSSGDTLSLNGDIYQIGEIAKSKTEQYYVTASYSNCSPDYIEVYSGYECSGYPATFADFTCSYTDMELHMEPKEPELQVTLSGENVGDECGKQIQVTLELASVKMASVDSSKIEVELPSSGGFSLVSSSVEMKYPLTSSFNTLPNPTITNNIFTYYPEDHDADLSNGLIGITDVTKNRLQFRFTLDVTDDYVSGDFVDIKVSGKQPCGAALPVINLAYDFRVKFSKPTNTGLTTDVGDSWGISWGDYDNDGFDDAFVSEGYHWWPSWLYHNNGDGTFTRITSGALVNDKGFAGGGTWGDYDNDGDLDIFVANNVRSDNHLYQNNGNGTFTRVDAGEISHYGGYCHNAAWVDYDNDGYLDMFVSDYMPTKYNLLYHNNGDGTFTRATDNAIALEAKFSMGATWADYDNDGLQDLFVPNGRNQNNSLYHNDGNGKFTKITTGDIVNDGGNSGGCAWGDYDNDGDMDLYVTNASDQDNFFYVNNGNGTFTKNTTALIATEGGHSHASEWADIDNDGDLDLFVTNDQNNKNHLYMNNGDGTFSKKKTQINEDLDNSFAAAYSDIDNDGDLDLLVANRAATNTFYLNDGGNCNNWKCLKLIGNKANKSGIGARIRVKATINGQTYWQIREISGQTGGGASAQSTLRAYFGLGDATTIDSLIIDWPSGFVQTMTNVHTNDCQDIYEASGVLIAGKIYNDLNENCQPDSGETGVPNILLEVNPGRKYVITDDNGDYKMYREYGNYTISAENTDKWAFECSTEHNVTYTNDINNLFNYTDYNFAAKPFCDNPDLSVTLSSTALRRGFRNTFAVSYINTGASAATNIDLVVEFDNDIVILSADEPWDQATLIDSITQYVWHLDTLASMGRKTIMLTDSVSTVATMGKATSTKAYFTALPEDCNTDDNMRISTDNIVGAIDPNDKLVWPQGSIMPEDTLTYKIRFQNVGSSYAKRVLILDTLSQDLDWGSFHVENASHRYRVDISDGGVLSFLFDHIYLADSVSNEPESHGFITYTIKPKYGTPMGTVIENRAAIQFDYNEYIITNTTQNRLVDVRKLAKEKKLAIQFRPNPMITESLVSIVHKENPDVTANIQGVEVFNTAGVKVFSLYGLDNQEVKLTKEYLSSALYVVRVWDKFGNSYSGKLVVN